MFADIFTCVLGLGAAMWTRKPILTLPCTTIQLLFLIIRYHLVISTALGNMFHFRGVVWAVRLFRKGFVKLNATNEDKVWFRVNLL